MLASNPFIDRTFSGARTSNLSGSSVYDRHYFPYAPQRNTFIKPGFLITNATQLPTVTCDLKSPYSSLSYNQEPRRHFRNDYVQNPFYKSHLLQDSEYNGYGGSYSGSASSLYGGMVESKVAPVYSNSDYVPGVNTSYSPNNYQKKGSKQSNQGSKFGLKHVNSQQSFQENSKFNEAYRNYNDESRPLLEQISTQIAKKQSGGNQPNPYSKKQSKQSTGSPTYPKQTPYYKPDGPVISSIIQHISEHPSEYDHDDPMAYNLPSFNQKFNKKQTLQSPTFNNPYGNPNAYNQRQRQRQRYDDENTWNKNKTSNAATGANYIGTGNTGMMTENQRMQNTGTQPRNGREGTPSTINYKGKVYYQVNVDEL